MLGDIETSPFWETSYLSPFGKDIVKDLHFWKVLKSDAFSRRCSEALKSMIQ